jgi:hypothetical protein
MKITMMMMMMMMSEHSVAKLLDGGEEGRDWRALGNLLGYKEVFSHYDTKRVFPF